MIMKYFKTLLDNLITKTINNCAVSSWYILQVLCLILKEGMFLDLQK